MDFKSLLQSMDAISETVHKGNYGNEYQPDQPRDVYGHKIPSAKKKEEPKKDVGGQSKADKFAGSTGGIQSMLGNKPKGKVGKVSAKRKLKDWIEVVEDSQLNETGVTIKPMPGASQIIGADGKPIGTADMQTANLIKQASEKGTLNLGTDEQGMAEDGGEKWIKGAIKHPGAFSAKAKRAGETTAQYAREKAHAPGTLGKQARLAQTLSKMHHEGVEETDNLDMPANSLDRMNEPNKKFYTNNPNAMRADRERVSTGANTLSDKGHERAGGAYKVRPSDPNKGKVTRLPSSFKNIKESVLNDSTGSTLQHILNTYKRDVKDFEAGAEMSRDLEDALYDYYFDDMPYGIKKARSGDPGEWIAQRFADDLGLNEGELGTAVGAGIGGAVGGIPGAAIGGVAGHYLTNGEETDEGWKGQLAGGTVGAIGGELAGAAGGPIGALAGGALGGTAGQMIGDKLGGANENTMDYAPEITDEEGYGLNPTPAAMEDDSVHSVDGGMSNSLLQDDGTCNMTEAGQMCPVHGIQECWGAPVQSAVPSIVPTLETVELPDLGLVRMQQLAGFMIK